MKVKGKLLTRVMEQYRMAAACFAQEMGVDVEEIEKLLNGESVGERTARAFLCYFGPHNAERLIDWKAMGKKNPFDCEADHMSAANEGGVCADGGGR